MIAMDALESLAIVGMVLAVGLIILGHGLGRAAAKPRPRLPMNAVPARHTPPVAPARAPHPTAAPGTDPELCAVITCTDPWTVVIHGWRVCARHDHRAPYDRTVDPELVSEEVEQWLRRAAS